MPGWGREPRGVLAFCKGVRVTRGLIGIKDQLECFTRHGLSDISQEWLLSGCSKNSKDLSFVAFDMRMCLPSGKLILLSSA